MRKFSLLFLSVFFSTLLFASAPEVDTTWKSNYEFTLGVSQTTFTNWSAGGENAFAMNTGLTAFKIYHKNRVTWGNYLGVAYGVSYMQESDPSWRKINDKINFTTKGGIYAWKNWDYAGLFEFRSQFAKGYIYPNYNYSSKLMVPGFFKLSIGLNYKPVNYFALFI